MGVSRTAHIVTDDNQLEKLNISTFKELRDDTFRAELLDYAGRTLSIVYVKMAVYNDKPMMPTKVEFWRFDLDRAGRLNRDKIKALAAAQKRLYRAELAWRSQEFFSDPLFVAQCDPEKAKAASEQAEAEIASILQWQPEEETLDLLRKEGIIAVKDTPSLKTWLQYAVETSGLDQDKEFAQAGLFFREGEEKHSLQNLPEDLPVRLGVGTHNPEDGDATLYYNRHAVKALQILWTAHQVESGARLAGSLEKYDLEPCYPRVEVGFLRWMGLPIEKAPFSVFFKDLL